MALSREWKESYLSEMAKAHQRMSEIAKLHPDWHFEPPKTLPRNDYEAARRITDFKRVNLTAFEHGNTLKYVVYWTDVSIPTYKGKSYPTKGQHFTRRQVADAEQAWEREKKAWEKLGLEGEPVRYRPGTQKGRRRYIELRSASNVVSYTQKRVDLFRSNILKSLKKQLGRFIDMGIESMHATCERVISKIESMPSVAVWNTFRTYISSDGTSDLFKTELFGSEFVTLSESNLDKEAELLGLETYTEHVTKEALKDDEERRAAIREEMLKNPPF